MRASVLQTLRRLVPVAVALLAGTLIGFLDVGATEVQGPLLLLMIVAFCIAMITTRSSALIGVAVFLGLVLAHVIAVQSGRGDLQFGMVIATVPILGAAFAGRATGSLLRRASSTFAGVEPHTAYLSFVIAIVGCALVGTPLVFATLVVRSQPNAWWVTGVWQVLTVLGWTVFAPAVLRLQARWQSDARSMNAIGSHAAAIMVIALLHSLALPLISRALLIMLSPTGWVTTLAWTVAAYLPLDAMTYSAILVVAITSDAKAGERAATLREAAVRGELATTQLAGLRAQLRPHFLFNALNAATVLARRGDAETTAQMLEGLAGLLRHVLRSKPDDARHLVPLRDEFAFAREYLEISRQRFEGRLVYSLNLPNELAALAVPHLLLQPLVENAIEHGIGGKLSASMINVGASRVDDRLCISVEDDGPGPTTADGASPGVGLTNTARRLAGLYGDAASIELKRRAPAGAVVTVVLPVRRPDAPDG